MRGLRFILVLGLLVVIGVGCNTPSVPIPPPRPELMTFSLDVDTGAATFGYDANADFGGAVVYLYNRDRGEGIITTADDDGSVMPTQAFPGEAGEAVVVSFELEAQFGSTCVLLREGRSSAADQCP